jgi:hypothetical protein
VRNKLELTKGTTLCRQGAFQVGAGDASCPFRCLTKPNRGVSNALALPWATPWLQPVVCSESLHYQDAGEEIGNIVGHLPCTRVNDFCGISSEFALP